MLFLVGRGSAILSGNTPSSGIGNEEDKAGGEGRAPMSSSGNCKVDREGERVRLAIARSVGET